MAKSVQDKKAEKENIRCMIYATLDRMQDVPDAQTHKDGSEQHAGLPGMKSALRH